MESLAYQLMSSSLFFTNANPSKTIEILFDCGYPKRYGMFMNVSKKLVTARTVSSLSMCEVARRAKMSKGLLSNLENGVNDNPSVKTLEKLAKVYRCKFTIG